MAILIRRKEPGQAWETEVDSGSPSGDGNGFLIAFDFVETANGAAYTAAAEIPAGARIMDLLLETTVAWTAATAPCDVGDSDAVDALAAAVDLAAQQGTNANSANGTNWGNGLQGGSGPFSTGGPGKDYPNGATITAVITPTVPGGPTGHSAVTLWVMIPADTVSAVVT